MVVGYILVNPSHPALIGLARWTLLQVFGCLLLHGLGADALQPQQHAVKHT